jgi:hypothetical protein
MSDMAGIWIRKLSAAASIVLGTCSLAEPTLATSPSRAPPQTVGSELAANTTEGSTRARTRKPPSKSEGAGTLVYEIIDKIRSRSEELCLRYGNAADCLEEAEVCLTMRDSQDNAVRLCLNTVSADRSNNEDKVLRSRLRR